MADLLTISYGDYYYAIKLNYDVSTNLTFQRRMFELITIQAVFFEVEFIEDASTKRLGHGFQALPLDYVEESAHSVLALYGQVVRSCNFWIPQVGGGGGGGAPDRRRGYVYRARIFKHLWTQESIPRIPPAYVTWRRAGTITLFLYGA